MYLLDWIEISNFEWFKPIIFGVTTAKEYIHVAVWERMVCSKYTTVKYIISGLYLLLTEAMSRDKVTLPFGRGCPSTGRGNASMYPLPQRRR